MNFFYGNVLGFKMAKMDGMTTYDYKETKGEDNMPWVYKERHVHSYVTNGEDIDICRNMSALLFATANVFCSDDSLCHIENASPIVCRDKLYIGEYLERLKPHIEKNNELALNSKEKKEDLYKNIKTKENSDLYTDSNIDPSKLNFLEGTDVTKVNYDEDDDETKETKKLAIILHKHEIFITQMIEKIRNNPEDTGIGKSFKTFLTDLKNYLVINNTKPTHILSQWHRVVTYYFHNYSLLNSI